MDCGSAAGRPRTRPMPPTFKWWKSYLPALELSLGAAVGLVDRLACPTIWLPVGCKFQAGMDGFSYANPTRVFFSLAVE
jgi:hypothetical protein